MDLNASLYADFHEPQRHHAKLFLQRFVPNMSWGNGSDIVMDVGCGPGDITLSTLLPSIPEVETIIAVDFSPDMIQAAEAQNAHPKITYAVADIADESSLNRWLGKISHLVSIYCIHWITDQKLAFRNIYNLLRENGEAIVLLVLGTPFFDAQVDTGTSRKWQEFTKNVKLIIPESHVKELHASNYKDMLEDIGFSVLACEEENIVYPFENNEVGRETLCSVCLFTAHIPKEMRNEFREDLWDYTIKRCGSDSEGRLMFKNRTLRLHLCKQLGSTTARSNV